MVTAGGIALVEDERAHHRKQPQSCRFGQIGALSTMARGFIYLAAVLDWFTRRVLAWRISITLEADFCIDAGGSAGETRHS